MKVFLTTILILICFSVYSQTEIFEISKLLGKHQKDQTGSFKKMKFCEVRDLVLKEYSYIFNNVNDTVFFLEKYDVEYATYYGRIWDKKASLNYSYFANKVTISNSNHFTNTTVEFISNWDTLGIRDEEKLYSNHPQILHGSRCLFINNDYQINTIIFRDLIFGKR